MADPQKKFLWSNYPDQSAAVKTSNKKFLWSDHQEENHPNFIQNLLEEARGLKGKNALETAGNVAGSFNRGVEKLGFPSVARGFFEGGQNIIRGVGNIPTELGLPGAPSTMIPKAEFPKPKGVNPYVETGAETIGGLLGMGPVGEVYQAGKSALAAAPLIKKAPEALRSLLAGTGVGSAVMPEHRLLGAGLGSASEIVPIGWDKFKIRQVKPNELAAQEAEKAYQTALENKDAPEETKKLEDLTSKISSHLGEGEPHDVHAAKIMVDTIEGAPNPITGKREGGTRKQIGSLYQQQEHALNQQNVTIPHSADMKEIEKTVNEITSKNTSKEDKEALIQAFAKQTGTRNDVIRGGDFLRAYREVKRQSEKAFDNAYSYGVSPETQSQWIKRGEELEEQYLKMEKILEKQLGPQHIKALKEINKLYATEVAPLNKHPMYQEMKKTGATTKNMMEYLRGTREGNDILNRMIKKNPELQRLIIGQNFAQKPVNLLKPNRLSESYIEQNPQLSAIKNRLKQETENVERAKLAAEHDIGLAKAEKLKRDKELQEALKRQTKRKNKMRYGAGALTAAAGIEHKNISDFIKDLLAM